MRIVHDVIFCSLFHFDTSSELRDLVVDHIVSHCTVRFFTEILVVVDSIRWVLIKHLQQIIERKMIKSSSQNILDVNVYKWNDLVGNKRGIASTK
jgi:hypothetical protein